jgi:Phytanoyl-CoA dioxygenase (PhyH)
MTAERERQREQESKSDEGEGRDQRTPPPPSVPVVVPRRRENEGVLRVRVRVRALLLLPKKHRHRLLRTRLSRCSRNLASQGGQQQQRAQRRTTFLTGSSSDRLGPCRGHGRGRRLPLPRPFMIPMLLLLLLLSLHCAKGVFIAAPLPHRPPARTPTGASEAQHPFFFQPSSARVRTPSTTTAKPTVPFRLGRLPASPSPHDDSGAEKPSRAKTSTRASPSARAAPTNPKEMLYEIQEQALVDRGVHEEAIMQRNVSPLGETVPPSVELHSNNHKQKQKPPPKSAASKRPTGPGGSGFGKGGAGAAARPLRRSVRSRRRNNVHEAPPTVDATPYATALRNDGVVRINSVLPAPVARTMREWVVEYRAEALQQVQMGKVASRDRFADVLLRHNRCDLTLPLGPNPVMDALYSVLCQSSVLPAILRSAFRSSCDNTDGVDDDDDPVLYELSTLISDPGSQRQVVHPDNPLLAGSPASVAAASASNGDDDNNNNVPVLLTCFVALQDVTEDMGPTVYLPGTHTTEAHRQFFSTDDGDGDNNTKDSLLESNPKVLGLLNEGDCSLYDSRVLHCGSANRHPTQSRALLYMSFRNPRVINPGNPASIRPDLAAQQLTLSQLQALLIEHWTTGTTTATESTTRD